ncbi:hypothetical protein M3Y97_00028000 [Aphelenchoides bicaudatus]|nr:hypothetical protein M3Y97_00028000 [Aphelenchoides bicaudatus]
MSRLLAISLMLASVLLSLMATNDTIDCYIYNSDDDPAPKTTSGCKACVNVTLPHSGVAPFHTLITQGCSYEEESKLGCRPVDDEGTMCICANHSLCNGDGKPHPPPNATTSTSSRAQRLELNRTKLS